jgi:hypothetical protein
MNHPANTPEADALLVRRFVCAMLGLASGAAGAVGIGNAVGNIFPALGRRIPYELFLLKPPGDIESSGICLIGGVFFLVFAAAFLVFGWTPSGNSPRYPHGEEFIQAAWLRMLVGRAVFMVPGALFSLFGIVLCAMHHWDGLGMLLFGTVLIFLSSAIIEPF